MRLPFTGLKIALGILGVCAVLAAAQAWAQPASMGPLGTPLPEADEKIQEVADAKTRFRNRDLAGALELLEGAVKKHPDRLPPAQVIMALWYAQANQGAATLGSLERAIVADPDDPQAYIVLANIELQGGRVTAAGLLFDKGQAMMKSFSKSPSRKKTLEPQIYAGLAAVAESRATMAGDDKARAEQEWIIAQGHLESWLKLDAKSAVALQRLARALFKQKTTEKVKAALQKLKDAKEVDPNVLNPYAQMAKFYQQEGDFRKAKEYMTYALSPKVGAKDLRTRLEAAQWCVQTSLLEAGQLDKAKQHAATAIQIDEKSLDAKILRGVVAMFQKEYEQAERYFQSASWDSPGNFPAKNNLALALCEQTEAKQRRALELADGNVRQFSQGAYAAEAASTYGWVLFKNNRVDEANKVFQQLLARSTRVSEDTLYYAARVGSDRSLGDRRRPERAKQLLQLAVKSERPFPMRPEAQRLLEQLKSASGP